MGATSSCTRFRCLGRGIATFADLDEVARLKALYGSMSGLRTAGSRVAA
ncbi:hypothetical protein ACO229_11480 [Promicromonospora sp. MS192]